MVLELFLLTLPRELSSCPTKDSKEKFINYANRLIERGAEGIVLGCTEIPMLVDQKDFNFPGFDTTKIHVESIIKFALEK